MADCSSTVDAPQFFWIEDITMRPNHKHTEWPLLIQPGKLFWSEIFYWKMSTWSLQRENKQAHSELPEHRNGISIQFPILFLRLLSPPWHLPITLSLLRVQPPLCPSPTQIQTRNRARHTQHGMCTQAYMLYFFLSVAPVFSTQLLWEGS